MCLCLNRITRKEAMECVYGQQKSLPPVSDRKLALKYVLDGTKKTFAKIGEDFKDNKAIAESQGGGCGAKAILVLTDILQVIQRIFEGAIFFLRFIPGAALPNTTFRPEILPKPLPIANRAEIFSP